jgi:O-antigen ligase
VSLRLDAFRAVKSAWPADGGLALARALMIADFVVTPIATSFEIVIGLAACGVILVMPEPRRRLIAALRQPVVVGALPLVAIIVVATFWGPAGWSDALRSLFAWRRVLLIPIGAALFFDAPSRRLLLDVFVAVCAVAAVISFTTFATGFQLTWRLDPGLVFHDHAVQGTTFSLAAIACVAALLRPADFAGRRLLGNRIVTAVILALLVIDVVFVLWGRSGAFAVVLMSATTVVLLLDATWRRKALAGIAVVACGGAILVASPHVRSRVADAFHQVATVDQADEVTSFGRRWVFWRNTARMIGDHSVFGVGTGGFQAAYARYVRGVAGWQGEETGDPHNQFLKFQAEQGVLGLAAFLFFIYWTLRCSAPMPWRALAAAALVGWCAVSLFSSEFSTHNQGRLIFFWLGAMLGGEVVKGRNAEGPG